MTVDLSTEAVAEQVQHLRSALNSEILGQMDLIDEALICLLAEGHLLMTGAPGLAKTTLVRSISEHIGIGFGRVQFTPDLLPSDIIGSEVLQIDPENQRRSFEFSKGPVFVNLLLADEINRASPRTQSALLEAMQERSVTVGGITHDLTPPFMVFATENPLESEGTFTLPEAQLDRFLLHSLVDYPAAEHELEILRHYRAGSLVGERKNNQLDKVLTSKVLAEASILTKQVQVSEQLTSLIQQLVASSRPDDSFCPPDLKSALWFGAGPRGGLSLIAASRAYAFLNGRDHIRWSDIKRLAKPVLRHRMRLSTEALHDNMTEDMVITQLLKKVEERHKIV